VAVVEPPAGRHARLELLARQLSDPVTAPTAALRLEAIGKEAIPTLRKALEARDAEVRFAAAEALAYRDQIRRKPELSKAIPMERSAFWPITVPNFSHLYRTKDEAAYRTFVQRNYGTL
jgi:HEAT repeat protein